MQLSDILFVSGIHRVTTIRNNLKTNFMTMSDKMLVRKNRASKR